MAISQPWRLDDRAAVLHAGRLTGKLHLERPEVGLTDLAWGDAPLVGTLWGWTVEDSASLAANEAPPPCRDAYVRGDDLVVTYGPSKTCPFETQLYWRAGVDSLTLIVSIRTHLLDTRPMVRLASRREAAETLTAVNAEPLAFATPEAGTPAVAVEQRLASGGPTIGEACHPDDQSVLALNPAEGVVGWELFSHFLEKGVIRRARLAAVFAESGQRGAAAVALSHLLAEPLPLTT